MAIKRKPVKEGDIFAVPLAKNMIAIGIVLHISKYFAGAILVGFFDCCAESTDKVSIADLRPPFAFTPNYTGKKLLTAGDWPVIGNRRELLEPALIPKLVVVTDVFYKDEPVERLPSLQEAARFEPVKGQGRYFLEDKLREYFARVECDCPR